MHTEHVENYLPDYVNHTLEESLRPWVERHLETCALCQAEFSLQRDAFRHLEQYQAPSPGPEYFATVLPRIRERLERKQSGTILTNPLVTRLLLPIGAGALVLFILFRLPVTVQQSEADRNPLKPVLRGLENEELVDVVLDQLHRQTITIQGESDASALLAVPFLRGEHLLAGADTRSMLDEPLLDVGMHETLDQLSSSETDALVARLVERTEL